MPSYSKGDVLLVRYPFTDLSSSKIRPAVVFQAEHSSRDILIIPLTSQTSNLLSGEFVLDDWAMAGLNVETAVKRGIFTVDSSLTLKKVGSLSDKDLGRLEQALRVWLGL